MEKNRLFEAQAILFSMVLTKSLYIKVGSIFFPTNTISQSEKIQHWKQ